MLRIVMALLAMAMTGNAIADGHWFDTLKANGDDRALYRVLHAMPKGGDLHNHNSGSIYPEWWLEHALAAEEDGYRYYTKIQISNCRTLAARDNEYLLLFRNIDHLDYDDLDACEQSEYIRLKDMTAEQKAAWLNSIKLDAENEGREEFFGKHWQRLNALYRNPVIRAENLYRNIKSLSEEGAIYAEIQVGILGVSDVDGLPISPNKMVDIFRQRLKQDDVAATGMTVKLQLTLLRFASSAEDTLRKLYKIATNNRDLVVGINLVGREDNDKGHPRRFLSTLRELRRQYDLPLAIHGGEVDEPNQHVRDTLLLGADRIGHGINLITDDDTMLLMRNGPYLIEINLISNLLLEYIVDYSQHPFPEYLRTDIPVALSTDDRGMWDSTLTDEFFVAVKAFNLSWAEIQKLNLNSLNFAFADEQTKLRLVERYARKAKQFERRMERNGLAISDRLPETRSFICARYQLCE